MWLQKVVAAHKINGVISDNRYGLYHPDVPSIFITHQLRVQTFMGKRTDDLMQNLHYRFINRFSECWIPDAAMNGLGGELSHPLQPPSIPVSYLGILSRFSTSEPVRQPKHLLIVLSGPEPQRTILEQMLLEQIKGYKDKVVWVRGLPNPVEPLDVPANIEVFGHLPAGELEQKMREARFVVSRCGYSTVMDIMTLQQKAIFIPTPGQTEQEYLARTLMKQNKALCIQQSHFQLVPALELAATFPYQLPAQPSSQVTEVVNRWVGQLQTKPTPRR
jgi:UDP-N-acetylglucosamine transferase subunit ALG13